MGLPLFVEPAKSAPSNKVSFKDSANSPSHADSRRPSSRSEISDRRNGIRRAGVRIYGPVQRTTRNSRDQRYLPWVESPRQQDRSGSLVANPSTRTFRPYQEALLGMTESDDRRGEAVDERMGLPSLESWQDCPTPPLPRPMVADETDNVTEGPEMGWWGFEPRLSTTQSGRLDRQQATALEYSSWRNSPSTDLSSRTLPPMFSRTVSGRDITLRAIGRHTTRVLPNADSTSAAGSRSRGLSGRPQIPPRRATRLVDGLGDRDRSLSPEMWDTLLSTLTADPQPPSASSSFASVPTTSQTAGPSSGTPGTDPDVVDEVQTEPVCESGCEYSDNEMDTADYDAPHYVRSHRQRQRLADVRLEGPRARRVPDFNLDGMSEPYPSSMGGRGSMSNDDPSMLGTNAAPLARNSGDGRSGRQINTPSGSITIYESTMRLRHSAEVPRRRASRSRSASQSNHDGASPPPQRGHFAQDAERSIRDGPQQAQDATRSASTAGPSAAEDDWVGMQRIVRSLARREDIPDGWWAEAGLSRILHQRADSSNLNVHSLADSF
ncbi:hypothetical protein E4U54_002787 [Claviceps lovelessii]|nr:hypothetical protein E4U54_002787 [Claviceps lovelessii]